MGTVEKAPEATKLDLSGVYDSINQQTVTINNKISDSIQQIKQDMLLPTSEWIKESESRIKQAINGTFGKVAELSGNIDRLNAQLGTDLYTSQQDVLTAISGITDDIDDSVTEILNHGHNTTQILQDNIDDVITNTTDEVSKATNTINGSITDISSDITEQISYNTYTITSEIRNSSDGVHKSVQQSIDETDRIVKSGVVKVDESIKEIGTKVDKGIESIIKDIAVVPDNIVLGMEYLFTLMMRYIDANFAYNTNNAHNKAISTYMGETSAAAELRQQLGG